MKILQVIPVLYASSGGPAAVVRSISKELAKRHELTVYTTNALDQRRGFNTYPFKVESNGYEIVYFPRILASYGFNISPSMAIALQKTLPQYDVVHLHSWRHFQDLIVHHYAKKYDIPYVLQAHGSIARVMAKQRLKWIYDVFFGYRLLKDASKVIALNPIEAEQYRGMGVPREKIAIIPNGIDLSEYASLPPRGCFRKKFGLDKNEKIVLYLGRIHEIKGIDILVRAFANILHELDDVRLVIVGPNDGYLGEIEALIKALQIEDTVLISGPLYGVAKLEAYVDADVYVLPSRYEIFGNTVLESVACGTPVILTESCGIAECFRDKVGLVVKNNSPPHLEEALLEMLINRKRQKIFKENCKIVIQKFNISETVAKLEEVYKEIITRSKNYL